MEIWELIQQRHSVRKYNDRAIEAEKRKVLDEFTERINRENDLHIQILYDEPECFNGNSARYGMFSGVKNYVALIGRKGANLDERLGYCGEQLVIKAQELGMNTCWVGLTHGRSKAKIGDREKQACLIALGYGRDGGRAHKVKSVSTVSNYDEGMPEWFLNGVKAALLAPTAMNQQKFFFELLPDGRVEARSSVGFYAKMDLGIAKYHFEAVTGKKVE